MRRCASRSSLRLVALDLPGFGLSGDLPAPPSNARRLREGGRAPGRTARARRRGGRRARDGRVDRGRQAGWGCAIVAELCRRRPGRSFTSSDRFRRSALDAASIRRVAAPARCRLRCDRKAAARSRRAPVAALALRRECGRSLRLAAARRVTTSRDGRSRGARRRSRRSTRAPPSGCSTFRARSGWSGVIAIH